MAIVCLWWAGVGARLSKADCEHSGDDKGDDPGCMFLKMWGNVNETFVTVATFAGFEVGAEKTRFMHWRPTCWSLKFTLISMYLNPSCSMTWLHVRVIGHMSWTRSNPLNRTVAAKHWSRTKDPMYSLCLWMPHKKGWLHVGNPWWFLGMAD